MKRQFIYIYSVLCVLLLSSGPVCWAYSFERTTSIKETSFDDGILLKKNRRAGIGASVAGAAGVAGLHIELNFTPHVSLLAGYGAGEKYQTYNFEIKEMLGGESLVPFICAGYGRWFTSGSETVNPEEITPTLLNSTLLNQNQKRTGRFDEHLLYPGLGLQYFFLSGDWAGFSIYAQFLVLLDIVDFVAAPTPQIGATYYF